MPEYSKDPRIVDNLIDGVNLTQDDMHMWLTPFTPNSDHFIYIEFSKPEQLAMLRIWNYNKSRIHCYRGAKDLEIRLDDKIIFVGEIARASGEIITGINGLGDVRFLAIKLIQNLEEMFSILKRKRNAKELLNFFIKIFCPC